GGEVTFGVTTADNEADAANNVVVDVAPGETITLGYECTFESQPAYEGTNVATAAWDLDGTELTATGEAEVIFEIDGETDEVVEVCDDQTDPDNPVKLGQATWNGEGEPTEFTYSLDHQGIEGETVEFTNTAWIETEGDNPQDSTVVEVILDGPAKAKPVPEPKADEPRLPLTGVSLVAAVVLALLLTAGGFALVMT